jgi:hypothetical protein
MITLEQYFGKFLGHPDVTDEVKENAEKLLEACGKLEECAAADGVAFPINPATQSGISGQVYGGFRPKECPTGAAHSSHKEGLAVDRFDPLNKIDDWCLRNLSRLDECRIYIEHPDSTIHWSHWTIKAPKSGHQVFLP